MRTKIIVTSAIAAGAVITALIATPALAAVVRDGDPAARGTRAGSAHSESTPGTIGRQHAGTGHGHGHGAGKSQGSRTGLADIASGTITPEQSATLEAMAAEEKLAHDLYVAFAEQYDAKVFTRVANSESKHGDAVGTLLDRYDIADPTVGLAAGVFSTDVTQNLYDRLLAEGSVSQDAAMEAARTVEKLDIIDLTAAAEGVTAPDVLAVYNRLLTASERHLVAFGG